METAYETNHCFGCGRDNPIGLKLDMKLDGDRCVAYFTPKAEHESYGDRYVFRKAGKPAYTARLEIRFRSAIRIGETVKVEGWPEVHRGRLFIMKGKITHADGTPAAEAKAEMMLAK